MEEKDITLLDNYFNGVATAEENRQVLNRVQNDPLFAEEFHLRRHMEAWPSQEAGREALAGTLSALGREFFSETARETPPLRAVVNRRRWMLAAAAVAVLAAALWFFSAPEPSLYRQYAQIPPLALVERGDAATDAATAEQAFNAGRYAEALAALDRLLAATPENAAAQLYRGICLLELNRPAEARRAFEPLAGGQSVLRADAQWYTALGFLLENQADACRRALQSLTPGDDHYEAAQELMKKLK